jgi:GNAT superfamily N-acetyltransferase
MSELHCKRLGLFLVLLAVCGFTADVLAFHSAVWFVAAPALAASGAVLYWWAAAHGNGINAVLALLQRPAPPHYSVSPVACDPDLFRLWQINRDAYGERGAIGFDRYLTLWRAYPNAVYALRHDGEIVGGLSVWPLRRFAFRNVLRGQRDLTGQSLWNAHDVTGCAHWYITGIVVRPDYRRHGLQYLLREIFARSLEIARSQMRVNICAVAHSGEGSRLLQRMGFVAVNTPRSAAGLPAYRFANVGAAVLARMAKRIVRAGVAR